MSKLTRLHNVKENSRIHSHSKSHQRPNAMLTGGEQFYEFLNTVGYQIPSKFTKSEHFEYLFKDEKTATLIKRLMKKGSGGNALASQEATQYEQLKTDGTALYGQDLEKAVDMRKASEKTKADENRKSTDREVEIQKLLTHGKYEIEKIEHQSKVISMMIAEIKNSKANRQKMISQMESESQNLNIQIQVTQKRINDRSKMLEEIRKLGTEALLNNKNPCPVFFIDLNWEKVLQTEDNFVNTISPLIAKHAANLIIQSKNSKGEPEPTTYENPRVDPQYADNFNRLTHCIIYEKVRNAKLEVELAVENGACNVLKSYLGQPSSFGKSLDIFGKTNSSNKDLDTTIYSLEDKLENEIKLLLPAIRENTKEQINNKFETLSSIKSKTNKRLESFFSQVYAILEPQKVRTDLSRFILAAEIYRYRSFAERMLEYSRKMKQINIESETLNGKFNSNNLTNEGKSLLELLHKHDLPTSVLQSTSSTFNSLIQINNNINHSNWSYSQKECTEYNQCIQNMILQHKKLVSLFDKLSNQYNSSDSEKRRVKKLEEIHAKAQKALCSMQENKYRIVEDTISEKQLLLEKMKAALSN